MRTAARNNTNSTLQLDLFSFTPPALPDHENSHPIRLDGRETLETVPATHDRPFGGNGTVVNGAHGSGDANGGRDGGVEPPLPHRGIDGGAGSPTGLGTDSRTIRFP